MAEERQRGAGGTSARGLRRSWDVAMRVKESVKRDRVTLVAAGVAFFAFLALFPMLFAVVALYGLVADPSHVASQVDALGPALPSGAREVIETQLSRIAGSSRAALGWGLAASLLVAFWSASKGVRGLIMAMNIAYGERETRGFLKRTGLTLLLTVLAIVGIVLAIVALVAVPAIIGALDLGTTGVVLTQIARWAVLLGVILIGLAAIYRFGPSREHVKMRWITPGSLVAAAIFILASVGFAFYVEWFGSYQQTFGAVAAVAILLVWFYLGALAIVVGAETNAAAESRAGPPAPA